MGLGTAQHCVCAHMCLLATFSTLLGRKFQHIKQHLEACGKETQFNNLTYDLKIVSCTKLSKT